MSNKIPTWALAAMLFNSAPHSEVDSQYKDLNPKLINEFQSAQTTMNSSTPLQLKSILNDLVTFGKIQGNRAKAISAIFKINDSVKKIEDQQYVTTLDRMYYLIGIYPDLVKKEIKPALAAIDEALKKLDVEPYKQPLTGDPCRIYNWSNSTIYYGYENSTSLKELKAGTRGDQSYKDHTVKLDFGKFIFYPTNNPNGQALYSDLTKKPNKPGVYICSVENGILNSKNESPLPHSRPAGSRLYIYTDHSIDGIPFTITTLNYDCSQFRFFIKTL